MKRLRISRDFYMPVIRAGIMLVLLWIVGAILKGLPMLKDLTIAKTSLSASNLVGMVVTLLMVVILINFAQEFAYQLKQTLPQFPQSGVITASLIYVIAVVIAYNAFTPLGRLLFKENFWVYQVGFLVLVLVPIWIGGSTLYSNTDKLIDLVTAGVDKAAGGMGKVIEGSEKVTCPECGASNVPEAKFCVECGAEIILPEEEMESVSCPECGTENEPDAKFCLQCGTDLTALAQEESTSNVCPECGTENEPDAGFCIECGADLSS